MWHHRTTQLMPHTVVFAESSYELSCLLCAEHRRCQVLGAGVFSVPHVHACKTTLVFAEDGISSTLS